MLENLTGLYPLALYGTAMCLAVAELIVPGRQQTQPLSRRWTANLGLFVLNLFVQRLCVPLSVVVVAEVAVNSGYGLLQLTGGPAIVTLLMGILLLDLWKYAEHRVMHGLSLLWRLHMVHHSDIEADFTTTERHHPLEAIIGAVSTLVFVFLIGIPPLAVVIYLLLATVVALFAHANISHSERGERWLRWIIVTPGVHSVHHSAARHETDSNFGMLLTIWDRVFGTYRNSTPAENAARIIGLEYFRDARSARIDQLLYLPFRSLAAQGQSPVIQTGNNKRIVP
ncbi:MAG: sterol desaturase family protein [Rhodospirillaceae bacterium]|jgi:sterol desaturase/sphingolipid hydroxylase (fatty acid hydroxylase superfamily)|nr:sterol desaturase family protein [Rhodospirillaceae bacterium]MBT5456738.1 sterol desaturase family protein [Rhodospirillaceae bacterium]